MTGKVLTFVEYQQRLAYHRAAGSNPQGDDDVLETERDLARWAASERERQAAERAARELRLREQREETERAEAAAALAALRESARAAYVSAGGDPAGFEAVWAGGLRDRLITERTARLVAEALEVDPLAEFEARYGFGRERRPAGVVGVGDDAGIGEPSPAD